MDTMQFHLKRYFPTGTRVTHPTGGAVLWLELPRSIDSVDLSYKARAQSIGIIPGAFSPHRTSFPITSASVAALHGVKNSEKGLEKLGKTTHDLLDLQEK